MKMFTITWGLLCFMVIVGLFIAYAIDQLPGVSTPQSPSDNSDKSGQVEVAAAAECSPCQENLERLKKAMEHVSREHEATVKAEEARLKKALEQLQEVGDTFYHEPNAKNLARAEKALRQFRQAANAYYGEERFSRIQQLVDQYGMKEGLRRLRESAPDAARQFDPERRKPSVPSEASEEPSTR